MIGSVRVMQTIFFHDLQCRSGLGDRLLDLWAARAIATLHDPSSLLFVRWHNGLRFVSFESNYSTDAFSIARCTFVPSPPAGAVALSDHFSHVALNDRGLIQLPGGLKQIVLRAGMNWGNSPPERLHADLAFNALDPATPLESVTVAYRDAASRTQPAPSIRSAIAAKITGGCIGLHVRLGDKIVAEENSFDMTQSTWRDIERQSLAYLEGCIAWRRPIFVCSDDPSYRAALIGHLRARGGMVITSEDVPQPRDVMGAEAIMDLFALASCSVIVQMTKYSTFSLAAALAGRAPLVNFFQDRHGRGHRLDIWRRALAT
jgi:hypothetical protein